MTIRMNLPRFFLMKTDCVLFLSSFEICVTLVLSSILSICLNLRLFPRRNTRIAMSTIALLSQRVRGVLRGSGPAKGWGVLGGSRCEATMPWGTSEDEAIVSWGISCCYLLAKRAKP